MKILEYTAFFERAEEGGYVVHVPALDGLTTEGGTFEEARKMAVEAITAYINACKQLGDPIPEEITLKKTIEEKISVSV